MIEEDSYDTNDVLFDGARDLEFTDDGPRDGRYVRRNLEELLERKRIRRELEAYDDYIETNQYDDIFDQYDQMHRADFD